MISTDTTDQVAEYHLFGQRLKNYTGSSDAHEEAWKMRTEA